MTNWLPPPHPPTRLSFFFISFTFSQTVCGIAWLLCYLDEVLEKVLLGVIWQHFIRRQRHIMKPKMQLWPAFYLFIRFVLKSVSLFVFEPRVLQAAFHWALPPLLPPPTPPIISLFLLPSLIPVWEARADHRAVSADSICAIFSMSYSQTFIKTPSLLHVAVCLQGQSHKQ